MKNLTSPILYLLFIIAIFACRKDKLADPVSRTAKHFPMAVGNYWLYDVIRYDLSTYSGTILNTNDTLKIIGVKNINGNFYFEFEENRHWYSTSNIEKHTFYRRDSMGYIVDERGRIHFTTIDFDNILWTRELSPYHYIDYSIRDSIIYEFTPAGTFECLDFTGTLWNVDHWDDRKLRNTYGANAGLVYQNIFYTSNPLNDIRRVLKAYHLED